MVRKQSYLVCDICKDGDYETCDRTVEMARKNAKRMGWKRKRFNGKNLDVCPRCTFEDIEKQESVEKA